MSNTPNPPKDVHARPPKVRTRTPRPAQPPARRIGRPRDPYHGQQGPALAQPQPRYRDPRGRQTMNMAPNKRPRRGR